MFTALPPSDSGLRNSISGNVCKHDRRSTDTDFGVAYAAVRLRHPHLFLRAERPHIEIYRLGCALDA